MRHYDFQDPDDRSPNSPSVIASSTRIIALYNQNQPDEKMSNVTQKVKDWFITESKSRGWSYAEFAGSECLLRMDF
jgi:hypothetical protein